MPVIIKTLCNIVTIYLHVDFYIEQVVVSGFLPYNESHIIFDILILQDLQTIYAIMKGLMPLQIM